MQYMSQMGGMPMGYTATFNAPFDQNAMGGYYQAASYGGGPYGGGGYGGGSGYGG